MSRWFRFSLVEILVATIVLSIGFGLNFTTRSKSNYRKYGWPVTAVEYRIESNVDEYYRLRYAEHWDEVNGEYWMPMKSVDTPYCIAFNCLFFTGLSLFSAFLVRRSFSRLQD